MIGVGSQGLLATLSLVARGAAVLVSDVNPDRVALATALGARALVPGDAAEPVDLVVDTVGTPAAVELALRHVVIGGTLLVLSLDATPFELTAQTLVRRQLVIRGSLTYDHPGDFAATVARVRSGAVSPGTGHHGRVPARRGPAGVRAESLRRGEDLDPGGRISPRLRPAAARAAETAARSPSR